MTEHINTTCYINYATDYSFAKALRIAKYLVMLFNNIVRGFIANSKQLFSGFDDELSQLQTRWTADKTMFHDGCGLINSIIDKDYFSWLTNWLWVGNSVKTVKFRPWKFQLQKLKKGQNMGKYGFPILFEILISSTPIWFHTIIN